MSKERLEEIKYELYTLHNCTDTDEAIKDFIFNHLKIEWIIEQAERVRELEEECAGWKEASRFNDEKLEQQNKRYREAIFKALDALPVGFKNEAVRILGEALEGEE